MTELQNVQLDMLRAFLSVCEALELRYFLVCGSALGAVKYGGFIPWDDDLDVGLPREDYEIFLARAGEYLPKHLFLQNYKTDPAFPAIYSKLRDTRTTLVERSAAALPICHGVYIDIFPLDRYPASPVSGALLELRKRLLSSRLASAFETSRSPRQRLICGIHRAFGCPRRTAAIAARLERALRFPPEKCGQLLCNHGNWQGKKEYAPETQYGAARLARFEGLTVRIPWDYDAYLTQKYGDWRSDPPPEQQRSLHGILFCDLSRSASEYAPGATRKPKAVPNPKSEI